MKEISLIFPAKNEEKNLGRVLAEYHNFFAKKFKNFEFIIVTSDCKDKTPEIADKISKKFNETVHLRLSADHKGKGDAVIFGLKRANGVLIGFVDADGSISPEEFYKLFRYMNSNDCVIGSRATKDSKIIVSQPFFRIALGKIFSLLVNCLFGLGISDMQCGAKLFQRESLAPVLPNFKSTGWEFDVELLWKLKKNRKKISEIGIRWANSRDSNMKITDPLRMLMAIIKIRFLS